tara:strand:+ start:1683 stop:2048 length:366 start_codon:yes stop_codon:yes gene_type:complete
MATNAMRRTVTARRGPDEVSFTVRCGISEHSLDEVIDAAERYNEKQGDGRHITSQDEYKAILEEACDSETLREYIVDTTDGLADGTIDEAEYLYYVISSLVWRGNLKSGAVAESPPNPKSN